ncbi:hypothetical protein [Streptomyces sp. ODS05-4]|uniref:hypothetical protein n=1 Tax=Streptomyces sp. ODS05-4 TaxID=2944939 RepID=UPI00210A43EF|nr:hypothetical protein [Streptomyces sp. ODS05-4]
MTQPKTARAALIAAVAAAALAGTVTSAGAATLAGQHESRHQADGTSAKIRFDETAEPSPEVRFIKGLCTVPATAAPSDRPIRFDEAARPSPTVRMLFTAPATAAPGDQPIRFDETAEPSPRIRFLGHPCTAPAGDGSR